MNHNRPLIIGGTTAYRQGKQDYRLGRCVNPYTSLADHRSRRKNDWINGWLDAQVEARNPRWGASKPPLVVGGMTAIYSAATVAVALIVYSCAWLFVWCLPTVEVTR